MKKVLLIVFCFLSVMVYAQPPTTMNQHAISINVIRFAANEINLSYDQLIKPDKWIEFNLGLVYANDPLRKTANNITDNILFAEHGFAARCYYKVYKQKADGSKWQDYISPGITYKYTYFNNQWLDFEKFDALKDEVYFERIYRHRFRNRIGLEFLWGKIYQVNKFIALDLFYGAGLTTTIADHSDLLRQPDTRSETILQPNTEDRTIYFRPAVYAGIKIRMNF